MPLTLFINSSAFIKSPYALKFTLQKEDPHSSARSGLIETDHGPVKTPIFMPVGTAGAVKAVGMRELRDDIHAQIILGNTYHLFQRPGLKVIEDAGGLHRFNSWNGPILTDSGGYQVYSLSGTRKIREDGVEFRSHIDGSAHFFTPEKVIDIQRTIGADIIMAFDECPPYPCERRYARESMEMTHRWLERCMKRMSETEGRYGYSQVLFPIVQGSTFSDLRQQSAEFAASQDAPGNAIGGLSVGEPHENMYEITGQVCRILPRDKPRYLMGVGTPANLLEAIALGVDMFDCVMPTRNARNGMLFTRQGIMNMRNAQWQNDHSPLDPSGTTYVDHAYSKAYLRHLIVSGEMLGPQIASIHNLGFYLALMREAREKIESGEFRTWKDSLVKQLAERI